MESGLEKGATVAPANASLCARHLVDGSDFVGKRKHAMMQAGDIRVSEGEGDVSKDMAEAISRRPS